MWHYFPLMLFTRFAHNAPRGLKRKWHCKIGLVGSTILLFIDLIIGFFFVVTLVRGEGEQGGHGERESEQRRKPMSPPDILLTYLS